MLLQDRTQNRLRRIAVALASLALAAGFGARQAAAQYKVTNLVSNQTVATKTVDPNLVNAWGIAFSPTGPFWISDNGTGLSTLYTGAGVTQSLVVTVPPALGSSGGSPTGIVFNATTDFVVTQNGFSGSAAFLFDTLDGTISGWSPTVNATSAVIAVDNSASQAVYTGLAIGVNNGANFIYAADANNNKVDVYNGTFQLVTSFTDPNAPPGFTPYGIQNINGQLYVTFASPTGATGGVVDIFDTAGNFVKTFASGGTLNQPWGLALSPSNFGGFNNAILVGDNLPGGTINAFNVTTGKFLGKLRDVHGNVIAINQLWGLAFGAGNSQNGNTNQLFFTAGPVNYADGLFGVIEFK